MTGPIRAFDAFMRSYLVRAPMTGPYFIHPTLAEWPNDGTWTLHYRHPTEWGGYNGERWPTLLHPADGEDVLALATGALAAAGYVLVGEWRDARLTVDRRPGGALRYEADASPTAELAAYAEGLWADLTPLPDIDSAVWRRSRQLAAGGAS